MLLIGDGKLPVGVPLPKNVKMHKLTLDQVTKDLSEFVNHDLKSTWKSFGLEPKNDTMRYKIACEIKPLGTAA